jgi:hypothetical protein
MLVEEAIKTVVGDLVRQILREELKTVQQLPPVEQNLLLVAVSVSTIKQWIRTGALTRYGRGRIVRVSRAQLLAHLQPAPPKHLDKEALDQLAARHLQRRAV